MKEIEIAGNKILVTRLNDGFHALGSECPHAGAPLAEGSLVDTHLRCPWHQAVFDAGSGELLQPCSLDSLPSFDLRIEGDDGYVTLPEDMPVICTPEMVEPDIEADGRTFVILGTGAAGMAAVEALRTNGFKGRIKMVTQEEDLPYHRTDLSKWFLGDPDSEEPFARSREFYELHGIEVLFKRKVVRVEFENKTIVFSDGSTLNYDRLLLATGSSPRRLNIPGKDLENILVLRSLADCRRIRQLALEKSSAVVVGASFIAMEVSAFLTERGMKITIVAPDDVPFARSLGPDIGRMFRDAHEEKGVVFRLGRTVSRFEGNRSVSSVVLDNGEELKTDMVILGIGVTPCTDYLVDVELNEDGSVTTDAHMKVRDNVYAAGDIATFPDWRTGEPIRIEHWRNALQLGRLAAQGMIEKVADYSDVPFFWTFQYSVNVKYAGFTRDWDEVVFDGDPAKREFIAYYLKDGRVEAVATCENPGIGVIAEILRSKSKPTINEIREALGRGK